ncbi:hypothetical protein F4804DRAFT_330917 [Jackrogersella minutella]|nr:hypothetical protein F4804DRAFT_330917 [Jackrogersella minutella]
MESKTPLQDPATEDHLAHLTRSDTEIPSTQTQTQIPQADLHTPIHGSDANHDSPDNDITIGEIDTQVDTDTAPVSPCDKAIEDLFGDLPADMGRDEGASESQDKMYITAFTKFQTHVATSEEHIYDCRRFNTVTAGMLERQNFKHVRVYLMESIAKSFLRERLPELPSSKLHNFQHCRWMYQGRKTQDDDNYPMDADEEQNPQGRDFSHLPRSLTDPTHCQFCGKEKVKFRCKLCAQKNGSQYTVQTGYCSRRCRHRDIPNHENVCWHRKRFARAVSLTKFIFMTMEEWITNLSLRRTSEKIGIVFLTERPCHFEAMRGDSVVHPFARSICEEVQAFVVSVKNAHRPIVRVMPDGSMKSNMFESHYVMRVTLFSGEQFAVDLSGGRYGWAESFMHWDHFAQERISRVVMETSPGAAMVRGKSLHIPRDLKADIQEDLLDEITKRIDELEGPEWLDLKDDEDEDFLSAEEYTNFEYKHVEKAIQKIATRLSKLRIANELDPYMGGEFRMYLNHDFQVRCSCNEEETDCLEWIWLNDNQIDQIRYMDMDSLKRFWKYHLDYFDLKDEYPDGSLVLPEFEEEDD